MERNTENKVEDCITNCVKCGNSFEYIRIVGGRKIFRKVCDDCRKEVVNLHKKRWRSKPEKFSKHDHEIGGLLKSSHEEIAQVLKCHPSTVFDIEQRALNKIRNNPKLKKFYDTWIDEGRPVLEGAISFPDADAGKLLLDYQLQVLDWWAVYDRIRSEGLTPEALECLEEIEKCQSKIIATLEKI